ncbi:hypothetical protein MSMEI_5429 [Mycolicibacterium smegmatis MC2 155]|uniref:Uncharacterized protein n=1 Tax=Mycolicibacterium smegmatis (strain ATCC 700084 / mc(2)155) TaxID=246196 RepID=I7FKS9_MYCS2|nr:hypothetical protein MSMEI_5429 [Mycolicibacterium smegmatis MC2 155]
MPERSRNCRLVIDRRNINAFKNALIVMRAGSIRHISGTFGQFQSENIVDDN